MELLFSLLLDTLSVLSKVGTTVHSPNKDVKVTFKPLFGSFDLVAKAPILNINQFNGKYGCPTCLNPGTRAASQYYLQSQNK